jgi:HK97 family phage major capsid protein
MQNHRILAAASFAMLAAGMAHLRFAPRVVFEKPNDQGVDVKALAEDVTKQFQKSFDEVKAIAEKAIAEAKKGVEMAASDKEKADEALLKMNGLTEQVAQIEQKLARGGNGGNPEEQKSLGQQFVNSEGFKSFQDAGFSKSHGAGSMSVKATLTSATTNAAGSLGAGVQATRLPGIVELPQRRLTIRDLITPGRMDGNSLEYVKETGFNNNAGMVAEGAAKPSSDLQLSLVSTSAKVIAHWMKASRQILSDIPQLESMIDQRLLYGLAYKEETQILNGDGTGQNLLGIIPQATAYSAAFTPTAETAIDKMRLAMLQAALAEFPATGHVMHPTDWARIELTKDAGGNYIIGVPQGNIGPTLWGLPVVATQAISIDKFLTGAFRLGAQLFDRWDARVEAGYENDDFTKNLVTILAEERLALAVYRPQAFIYGDLGYVA